MEYIFVDIECENRKATTSELKGHEDVINDHAKRGYKYAGYLPTKMGPSGKILSLQLVFEKLEQVSN
jgi:hypothetical protein